MKYNVEILKALCDTLDYLKRKRLPATINRVCRYIEEHNPSLKRSLIRETFRQGVDDELIKPIETNNSYVTEYICDHNNEILLKTLNTDDISSINMEVLNKLVQIVKDLDNETNSGCSVKMIRDYIRHKNKETNSPMKKFVINETDLCSALGRCVVENLIVKDDIDNRYKPIQRKTTTNTDQNNSGHEKNIRQKTPRHQTMTTDPIQTSTPLIRRRGNEKKKVAKPIPICGFCLCTAEKGPHGRAEEMISCSQCGNSGHPSCLKYSDQLLLFCDFCDSGVHASCCDPPLTQIPKDEFMCDFCRDEGMSEELNKSPQKKQDSTKSNSSPNKIRPHNSKKLDNEEEQEAENPSTPTLSRSVAQLIDGMTNFFLPKKQKQTTSTATLMQPNQRRQNSVQKAAQCLRKKTQQQTIKRSNNQNKQLNSNSNTENRSLAKHVLAATKTERIRRKPVVLDEMILNDDSRKTTNYSIASTPLKRRSRNSISSALETPSRTTRSITNQEQQERTPIQEPVKRSLTLSPELLNKRVRVNSLNKNLDKRDKKLTKKTINTDENNKGQKRPKQIKKKKDEHSDEEEEDSDSDDIQRKRQKSSSLITPPKSKPKKQLNIDFSKYNGVPAFLNDTLPDNITEHDIELFLETKQNAAKLISDCSDKFVQPSPSKHVEEPSRWPPFIVFGNDLIKTWYSSSYPQEYARVPRLFICEFCLKYMKCEEVYERHRQNCQSHHPPANEIYHKENISVFEVDGNISRIYCQNLCLLAKLFLDHKTLYYDVEPFLFYVLTRNDQNGCHFIGYFSKEKHCPQKYNLSCITVLPNCQRKGYGRFLIELSYLLSRKEWQVGTPEKPLSDLGRRTYETYWKYKIIKQLLDYNHYNKVHCNLKQIMYDTGMATDDIIDAMQNLRILTMKTDGKPVITFDVDHFELLLKQENDKHKNWIMLDPEFLRWTPVLTPQLLTNEEKAIEKQVKDIQIVFKGFERDTAEAATSLATTPNALTDGTSTTRYIKRRKFGSRRKSVYVKCRKSIKLENDRTIGDEKNAKERSSVTINGHNGDGEEESRDSNNRSAEYSQQQTITDIKCDSPNLKASETTENEKEPEEKQQDMWKRQSTLKQSKLDQFFIDKKKETVLSNGFDSKNNDQEEKNIFVLSIDEEDEEEVGESASQTLSKKKLTKTVENVVSNENQHHQHKLRTRHNNNINNIHNNNNISVSRSDTTMGTTNGDKLTIQNSKSIQHLTSQISDGGLSTSSCESISTAIMPLPFKKRAWTSSSLQTLDTLNVDTLIGSQAITENSKEESQATLLTATINNNNSMKNECDTLSSTSSTLKLSSSLTSLPLSANDIQLNNDSDTASLTNGSSIIPSTPSLSDIVEPYIELKKQQELHRSQSQQSTISLLSSSNGNDPDEEAEKKIAKIEKSLKTTVEHDLFGATNDDTIEDNDQTKSFSTSTSAINTSSSSIGSPVAKGHYHSMKSRTSPESSTIATNDDNDQPPSLTCPTNMIVSTSSHYNHHKTSSPLKPQQQQHPPANRTPNNNFNHNTTTAYNFSNSTTIPDYRYPYPSSLQTQQQEQAPSHHHQHNIPAATHFPPPLNPFYPPINYYPQMNYYNSLTPYVHLNYGQQYPLAASVYGSNFIPEQRFSMYDPSSYNTNMNNTQLTSYQYPTNTNTNISSTRRR
ncbi:unnamed protein product [Didymodactylos carnosus]|uniref:histone acetyltransferase n=1 Tax=Didymodactylos carnosus TaxID=1234261 RepID=A0A813YZS8_9BILA|nr:unnamed protein product [Didymodactylos carnosus]CAF0912256.1 unnamed protein product [Didymodactylos carnosus]CAF3675301.1 unnamed protein product [Didymodactylos carnosus]CAF3691163.1 unnamed protein product [Didymodactylos carnosus]